LKRIFERGEVINRNVDKLEKERSLREPTSLFSRGKVSGRRNNLLKGAKC
jgi:hypothetical protein